MLPWSGDSITLCFDSQDQATQWHETLTTTIASLPARTSSLKASDIQADSSEAEAVLAGMAEDERRHAAAAAEAQAAKNADGETSAPSGAASSAPEHSGREWRSVRHVNGVAVYAEHEGPGGEGGAVMASSVVRAPPKECFLALMRSSSSKEAAGDLPFSDSLSILETIDAHTHVVRHSWAANGPLCRLLCAPRDMVTLRTWRKEPDGTFIVLYQSITHRKARESGPSWFSFTAPVRAKVEAAGFTIAPLLPEYVPGGGPSQECLVTLVIKADLGGALADSSLSARLAPALTDAARWALLEPLLMSVVRLRDRVEQSRFTVMPYSMAADEGSPEASLTGLEDGAEQGKALDSPGVVFQRTTTALTIRNPTPLHAVAEDPAEETYADALSDGDGMMSPRTLAFDGAATPTKAPLEGSALMPEEDAGPAATPEPLSEAAPAAAWGVSGTTLRQFWSYPGTCNLRIRGPHYLEDKVKIPAVAPMFDLYASDLIDSDEPLSHIARGLPSVQHCQAPFAFILNLIYPNAPLQNLVTVWTAPVNPQTEPLESLVARWGDDPGGTCRAFFHNLKHWLEGDGPEADKRRNTKFKLIPRVAKGSWVVRQSVGTTPVLLGQKLTTKYFRGTTSNGCSYFEVDVDITSNTVANSVTRLVVNSITSLVVDLAPLVEGQAPEELPERLIGTVRYDHLDLRTAATWDEELGVAVPRVKA